MAVKVIDKTVFWSVMVMNVLRVRAQARMVRILSGDGLCVVQSLLLLLLMVVLLMPGKAEAVIYKCVSEEGAMTFSDRPCKGVSRELINLRVKQPMRAPAQTFKQEQDNTKATTQPTNSQPTAANSRQKSAATQTASLNDQCQYYRTELSDLKKQLSAGYSVPRKKNFQTQLERLKDKIREACR